MQSERFVIDDRRLPVADAPTDMDDAQRLSRSKSAREQDGGALSEGMRSYILEYGGPVTAEPTNPFGIPS